MNSVQRAPASTAASGCSVWPWARTTAQPEAVADLGRDQLADHAAGADEAARAAGHGLDLGGDHLDDGQVAGGRVAAGVGGVEAVDVGQQDQRLGQRHDGDAGGEAVIVAEADLVGRHRVVLVDDRDDAQPQQGLDGGAGVEVAAAGLGVVERDQDLGGLEAGAGEALLPGTGEQDLARGGGGLLLLQPQRALRQAQPVAAQCYRTGGDDGDLLAARRAAGRRRGRARRARHRAHGRRARPGARSPP